MAYPQPQVDDNYHLIVPITPKRRGTAFGDNLFYMYDPSPNREQIQALMDRQYPAGVARLAPMFTECMILVEPAVDPSLHGNLVTTLMDSGYVSNPTVPVFNRQWGSIGFFTVVMVDMTGDQIIPE